MDTLRWRRQSDNTLRYELAAGEEAAAWLQFEQRSSIFGSGYGLVGHGGAGEGSWTMKHTHILGLTHQRIHVVDDASALENGLFKIRTFGSGVLQIRGGDRYHFNSPGFLSDDRVWKAEDGRQVMRLFTGSSGDMTRSAAVEVQPELRAAPEFALLATLGCYLYILRKGQERQAARDLGGKTRDWWEQVLG
jgi:hypothetical protein